MNRKDIDQRPELSGRLALSRTEAAEAIGASAGFIDLEIRRRKLRAIKRGRKVLILRSDLLRYLEADDV